MRTIMVVMNMEYGYMRSALKGVAAFVRANPQWRLNVESLGPKALDEIARTRPAGVLTHGLSAEQLKKLKRGRAKVVTLFEPTPREDVPNVTADLVEGSRLMGQQLAGCGFRRFGFVGGSYEVDQQWLEGFCQGLGRELKEVLCYKTPRRSTNALYWKSPKWHKQLAAWLEKQSRPLALGCCSDIYAYGVLEACRLMGWKVPDELAVMGIGDDDVLCQIADPPLSSVAVPWGRIGLEAATLITRLAEGGKNVPLQTAFAPSGVVPRASSDVSISGDEDVAAAARYIRQHYNKSFLNVEVIARHVALSRRSLERRFRQHLGWTIIQEIRRVRVERAKQLLAETDLPIHVIARQIGLGGVERLIELFTPTVGLSPGKFRDKFRTELPI